MDLKEDAGGVAILCEGAGFRYMAALIMDVLCVSTLGAVPDEAEGFKLTTVRFHDVTVIDIDDGFVGNPLADGGKVGFQDLCGNALMQVPGGRSTELAFLDPSWSCSTMSVSKQSPEARMPYVTSAANFLSGLENFLETLFEKLRFSLSFGRYLL